MPADLHHRKAVDAKAMIPAVVPTETVVRNTVAAVTAALLPGTVLRLPAVRPITLPSDLLFAYLSRAPLLCGPVVLLTLLVLLVLLHPGLLLPPGIVLLLTLLLPLLVLLPFGLLLPPGIVLLLALLLPLLVLLPFGLLLPPGIVLLLTLLPLLVLLLIGLRPVLLCGLGLLFLLFRFVLLFLARFRRNSPSEKQEHG